MNKIKYFIIFLAILLFSLSVCAAADDTNITRQDTQHTIEDTYSYDNNVLIEKNDKDINKEKEECINTKGIKKKNITVKGNANNNVTTITEDNYNDYISINSAGKVTLKQAYFVPGNNYTVNFTYLPAEAKQLAINNFYNNKYRNDTLTISGTINNINLQLSKGNLKSLELEDSVLNYDKDYTGDYVNIPSMVGLNHVTINVDSQRDSSVNVLTVGANTTVENCTINLNASGNTPAIALNLSGEYTTARNCIINANITSKGTSSPLYIGGQNSVVENCTINAYLPSSQVAWMDTDLPKGIGVWITGFYSTLRNNRFNITESCILSDGTHRSLYGVYVRGNNLNIYNNTVIVTGTQYTYGFVVRASQNRIYNNNITVKSVYYSAGVNIEGNGMKNNYIYDNRINVSAGFEQTDQGNPDVAYGCLILDFSYGGGEYVASISSMENNRYINNTVIADARQSYAFELYGGVNTQIIGNNMTLTGNYPMGIGAIGINTTMDNNAIYVDGNSNGSEYSVDYIKPTTVGIYTYWMNEGNIITNNTIAVTNGKALKLDNSKNVLVENNFLLTEDYAYVIEVDNINNTFKYNAILGEGTIEEVIKDTTDDENTYINNREPVSSQLVISPDYIPLNEEENITVLLKDVEGNSISGQYVQVQIDGNLQTYITDADGTISIPVDSTIAKTMEVSVEYECYNDFGCAASKQIRIAEPIILTPDNFDMYITNGLLNENVPDGATIDVHGKFDNERYAFNITKPVNMLSTTGDAFFCFYSTPKLEGTSELPDYSFIITSEGSGTNITDIQFENTMIVTTEAHDITFDNITSYCTSGYGWGRGSTSIRNSQNVTIKNSYFNTTDNNGVSTVVFAASQNCLLENSTVVGSGFIGNLVYATTYNVDVNDKYGNNNITIRGNKIMGRDLQVGSATCYSVCVIGDNITVENNYIENSNKYLIMTQYKDDAYEVAGSTGGLTIRNNSFGPGKIGVTFNPCTITNNTFYGNVTLEVTENTIQANNTNKNENENPYVSEETSTTHPTKITINAPQNYIYEENTQFTITVTDQKTNTPLNKGYIEVYSDGTLYKNITINQDTTTFTYNNQEIGPHHVRVWYYSPDENIENTQKLHTIEAQKITGQLKLETKNNPEIGETITLKVTYTLNKNKNHQANITFELPGQKPITITAANNSATLETTITTDYTNLFIFF
ncbi:hypothetical protein PXD04_00005 [Methanosphaera sp. ISO3-F5]|uniref:hypothetical protein n=1 Tax=Methanosphaera sp. ISO3-F5 TaxID=1452353 RepID=UPI002B25E955|nr:hypothetical protein [Methanosphaera sp. ISO3-F5]WQH64220.1 hypothetical protein PXD04_00005 [Methanosphaera sp. ISO3-F5]